MAEKIKVGLDGGHGVDTFPPNKGVYVKGKGYPEHEFNAIVVKKLKKLLEHNGFEVVMIQKPFAKDVPLTTRTNYYNAKGVDIVVSIHANANSNDHVEGRCVFFWHTSSKGKKLAKLLVDEIKKMGYETHGNGLHASERGSWTNLHICRETNMPAILSENGFMTNDRPGTDDDFELLFGSKQESYTSDVAEYHARALCKYFGKSFKDLGTQTVKPPKPQTKPESIKKPNIGYNGTSVVDYLNHIGKDSSFSARKRYAKQYGVPNYKGTASQNLTLLKNMKSGNKAKPSKSISQMAQEIIDNPKAPNGHSARRKWLGISHSEYEKVRDKVNEILLGGKQNKRTINEMADEIIRNPNAPNGHEARRKWLGIDNATYQKVRNRVNQLL